MIVCRYVLQKINGWKIYHLAAGMEDIVDMESELSKRLQEVRMMHKRMVASLMKTHHLKCLMLIKTLIMFFFRPGEGLRRPPTVRWGRSLARWSFL